MDYCSTKLSNLLFSLLVFSQLLHLTLSYYDDHIEYTVIHPEDEKVLIRIQKLLGTQPWTNSGCCATGCSYQPLQCGYDGHVWALDLTFNSPTSAYAAILTALADLPFLTYLELSGSYFTSRPFPGRALRKLTNLTSLSIRNTSITGPIPGSLFGMENLSTLKLTNNKFLTGQISKGLTKLTNLRGLDLSSNRLSGPIPDFLGRMSNLSWIILYSNKLSGPIPTSLGRLINLQYRDFSHNQLTGSIPNNFFSANNGMIDSIYYCGLSNNQLTGSIPMAATAQPSLWDIDLSNNKLTDASNLFRRNSNFNTSAINISNNRFKFNISNANFPKSLSELNISHNMIYGSIPKPLGKLRLRTLDMSYNQLCGPIPGSPVLKRINPTSFAHNKCLCGAPLAPCK